MEGQGRRISGRTPYRQFHCYTEKHYVLQVSTLLTFITCIHFSVGVGVVYTKYTCAKMKRCRLLLLKVEADLDRAAIEWLATIIDMMSRQKTVQFLMRHEELAQRNIQLHCVQPHRLQPTMDALTAEGFTMNQRLSSEVMVCEGQRMSLQFKGNIVESEGAEHKFIFWANRKTAIEFAVKEQDKFAQKSSEFFRGKLLIITSDDLGPSKPNDIGAYANPEVLCELDLQIPKVLWVRLIDVMLILLS
jgi:hypothetical protein